MFYLDAIICRIFCPNFLIMYSCTNYYVQCIVDTVLLLFFLQQKVLNDWSFFYTKHLQSRVFSSTKVLRPKKYLEVLFGKFGAYKSNYTLKPLLSKNMVNFTLTTKSGSIRHSKSRFFCAVKILIFSNFAQEKWKNITKNHLICVKKKNEKPLKMLKCINF